MRLGITGHQHVPPEAIPSIRAGVLAVLATVNEPITAVTSLAAGADQIVAELILERGGHLHAVVPCSEFAATFEREADAAQHQALLDRATHVERLLFDEGSDEAYLAAGHRVVDLSDRLIAVWDGQPSRGLGGTADIVSYARSTGVPIEVVWPPGLSR